MAVIHTLSPHVADLIAAGEVVERPASAVKELIENAIDAGAKQVTVEIQNGGITFLRVTDDGCGMAPDDAETAFLRHATSKIRDEQDLAAIGTLGFRGEALAAISAVSRIDLLTRTPDAVAGTALHLEAGTVTERGEAGCPVGTTILVRDLFYNTPARMKFLKRDAVEASAVAAAVQKQALAHPDVAITLLKDGAELLRTPGDGNLRSTVYAVYGRQLALDMVPVDSSWDKLRVTGFVTTPAATRGNRSYQTFYVNSRPVVSKLLISALEQAYQNQLMVGRFPACVLHLQVPAAAIDVNVHPAKTEIKFLAEHDVFDCLRYGVQAALNAAGAASSRPAMQFGRQAGAQPTKPTPKSGFYQTMPAAEFHTRARDEAQAQLLADAARVIPALAREVPRSDPPVRPEPAREPAPVRKPEPEPAPAQPEPTPVPEQQTLPLPETVRQPKNVQPPQVPQNPVSAAPASAPQTPPVPWRLVGEVLDTYVIVQQGEQVLFLDKHAAHERILFERLREQETQTMSQLLLAPQPVTFSREDTALLLQNLTPLRNIGYELEDFGSGTLLIRQVPSGIDAADAAPCLEELAAELRAGRQLDPKALRDRLLHTVACKAAIKAGQHSDPRELEALVAEVLSRDDIRYCPHGRPVCITLSRSQLERQFKRS